MKSPLPRELTPRAWSPSGTAARRPGSRRRTAARRARRMRQRFSLPAVGEPEDARLRRHDIEDQATLAVTLSADHAGSVIHSTTVAPPTKVTSGSRSPRCAAASSSSGMLTAPCAAQSTGRAAGRRPGRAYARRQCGARPQGPVTPPAAGPRGTSAGATECSGASAIPCVEPSGSGHTGGSPS